MQAEIIAIGDELTSGQRLDTNSQWLSQQLGELGIRVLFHSTVGDDLAANVRVLREAFSRANVVVCTGGLGPTADDLTRQALAEATQTELVQDDEALAQIRAMFARRQRPMPDRNVVQAMFPKGSRVIPNPHGTAPGIDLDVPHTGGPPTRVFALPGVPAEMIEMWEATVRPALAQLGGGRVIRHRQIKCFGVGESDLEQMLPDLIRRGRQPTVGITVSQATISLRVTADGESPEACSVAMQPTVDLIHESLKSLVFGEGDLELQHAVVALLLRQQRTVATAEWGTGGLIADWLSEAAGTEDVFRGGVVIRNRDVAARWMGREVADRFRPQAGSDTPTNDAVTRAAVASNPVAGNAATSNAVTSDAVCAMASRVKSEFGSDYAVAVGPFPEPDSPGTAAGAVIMALATPSAVNSASYPFGGHPEILKPRSAKQALNLLRLDLLAGSE